MKALHITEDKIEALVFKIFFINNEKEGNNKVENILEKKANRIKIR